jgi:hypothetical protein
LFSFIRECLDFPSIAEELILLPVLTGFSYSSFLSVCENLYTIVLVTVFSHYDKIPKIISSKGGKVYFGLLSWRFQSMVSCPVAFGPVARHYIMAETHGKGICLPGSKER